VFLQEHDFSVGDMRENERRVAAFAEREAHRPFDLAQGPLMRIHLLRLARAHHLLLVSIHHIVAEGWAMDVFADEFSQLYRDFSQGRAATLPPLAIQYPDFAAWQRTWLGGGEGARQLAYWKQRLGNEHPVLELPFDRARPAVQQFEGDFVAMELPPALAAEVAAFNRRHGVTLFMTVMTAMMALLHRYSGQADLRIGYPIANRTRPEFERLIGGFLNTQVLQCDIDAGMTAADLLAAVREAALEAQAHQDVPFHAIVDELRPQRSASHSPLFQVMCNVQRWRFQQTREVAPGLQLEFEGNDAKTAKFDLLLDVTDIDGRFACVFSYQTALFNRATIERLARHWRGLLSEIVRRPDTLLYQLPLLETAERQQLLAASSHARSRFEVSESLPARFERQVARRGQAIAVSAEDGSLSYAALNARANQLARALRQQGVGPDVLVGLAVQRSLDTIVGMLGILKAGGAYLPLDPDYPPERLAFMLTDARPALVLTQARVRDALPATDVPVWCLDSDWESIAVQEAHDLQVAVHPANLAYCIYTSGSTGKPKGALLTHANAQRLFLATESQFGFGDHDVWTMFHSYAFDFSVWEVFGALLHGGRLVVVPYLTSRSPADFLALLQRENVTVLNQTPSAFRQLMQVPGLYQGGVPDSLRYVVFGGEALDLPGLRPWFAQRGETMPTLVNMYGITETTVHVSWRPLTAADAELPASPVGAPLADLYWHVLDADLEPAPAGVKGELYIGGAGLARGYLGRQALTAERFLPDPFSALAGARLYRTGDTARRTADGEMEYLGRADSQVKIRGFRIEPGEIEARLREHPQVADAVVAARKDDSGHAQLVAYVVANAEGATTAAGALQEDLRAGLNACLPAYMVPSAFVLMPVLPLTVNGKLDQRSLPAPTYLAAAAYQDAQDPLQEHLARIWKQVLDADRVGIHDNFFELGGDSIAAVRMVGHAREAGLLLTPQMLFQYQTIASLAAQMQNPDAAAASPAEPATALFDASPYALTPMQEGILFHSYAQRDQGTYIVQCSCEIRGELDEAAFMASWRHALASHDILRTGFALDDNGQAQQTVHRHAALPLAHHDWSGHSVAEQQARLQALLDADHRTDFALDAAPLMRLILVRLGPQQRHLIWTHHHLLMDAWSVDWLLAEVARTYHALAAGQTPLAPAVTPFRDYVAWLHAQDHGRARAWWQDALSGLSEPLLLRRTMTPSAPLPGMGRLERSLSAERTAALGRYARSQRVTLNTLVQGALLQALATLTRQGQPVLGVTVSGRDAPVPGILAMKGLFINTVPLFMDIAHGDEVGAWLRKLQDKNIGLREHAMLPLVEIQSVADVARGTPLFDVIFVFENHPLDERLKEDIRRLGVGDIQSRHRNGYPLTVIVWPEDELRFLVLHEHQHMDDEQAGRLFERLDGLLSDWCRQPALVGGALWRTPSQAAPARLPQQLPARNLHAMIEQRGRETPLAIAVSLGAQTLSYRELNRQANRLARKLRARGVGAEQLVGLATHRTPDMLVALLAILKAGAAYLPLDPKHPPRRLAAMLADARPAAIIAHADVLSLLPAEAAPVWCLDRDAALLADEDDSDLDLPVHPDNLAYCIYTSGSTGVPKGALLSHANVLRLFETSKEQFGFGRDDVWTMFHSHAFDFSVWEIFGALLHGGRLVLVPYLLSRSPDAFLQLLVTEKVTVLNQTPSAFRQILELPDLYRHTPSLSLRQVIFGGEALDVGCLQTWFAQAGAQQAAMINMYGITETTVHVTYRRLSPADAQLPGSPVGLPLADLDGYVLDADLNQVPDGCEGELYVGGAGLARGYLKRAGLSADRFIPDPYGAHEGGRLYRTGDLVRRNGAGVLDYLGRIDQQVKVRGFRIELGEIEARLRELPGVRDGVVLVRGEADQRHLMAYVVTDAQARPDDAAAVWKEALRQVLPDYMVPAALVEMERFPLTINGKLDRAALAAAQPEALGGADVEPAVSATEVALANIWSEVLGLEQVGVTHNFLALGGHSLSAVKVGAQVKKRLGVTVPLAVLFELQSIRALAQWIDQAAHLNRNDAAEMQQWLQDLEGDALEEAG